MFSKQEEITVIIGKSTLAFNNSIITSVQNSNTSTDRFEVRVASPGYKDESAELYINSALNCFFGDLYEIRLLSTNSFEAKLLITKLPIMESAEGIFSSSSIFNSNTNDEVFTECEIAVLKQQLDELKARMTNLISEVHELTEAQNDYLKASFDILNEKLDTGTKESWRQCAYGVFASIGCTFMPDAQTTQSLFQVAGSYISSASSLLLNGN